MFRFIRLAAVLAVIGLIFAASFRVGIEAQNGGTSLQDTSVPDDVRFDILHPIDGLPRMRFDKFTGAMWWLEQDVRDTRWRPIQPPGDARRVAGAVSYRLYPAATAGLFGTVLLNVHSGDAWILRQRGAGAFEWDLIDTAAR
jgi:hypothetical protein